METNKIQAALTARFQFLGGKWDHNTTVLFDTKVCKLLKEEFC